MRKADAIAREQASITGKQYSDTSGRMKCMYRNVHSARQSCYLWRDGNLKGFKIPIVESGQRL